MEEKNLYNQVTIKNIDNEDFVFQVNKIPYLLRAGEVRNFPKFMTVLAVRHLIDKVLNKKDPEGKLVARADKRAEVAAQIVLGEEQYEQPQMPTDQQLVAEMNKPTDLESALQSKAEPTVPAPVVVPTEEVKTPDVSTTGEFKTPIDTSGAAIFSPPTEAPVDTSGVPAPEQVETVKKPVTSDVPEKFDQVEEEKALPLRKEMIAYAKDTLKLDVENSEIKKRFKKLSDKELFSELQMGA